MPRLIKKRSQKAGFPPGTLVHIGEKKTEEVKITTIKYDETHFEERVSKELNEFSLSKNESMVTWINVDGIHQLNILERLGDRFGLHPLILEDILNTDQRPKIEDMGGYIYVVLKILDYDNKHSGIMADQISLILGPNFVLTFQEKEGEIFNPVRERIRTGKGRVRTTGADYLAYSLVDAIIDGYFAVLEKLGESIEFLEEKIVTKSTPETLQILHGLKREMIFLRKSVWPLREVISALERGESSLFKESTRMYLGDVYDHTIQVIDVVETFREMLSGMLDIYLSSVSNRLNKAMEFLAIVATVFMPITFIAGVYGMNFKYMPELEWRWGYPVVWFVTLAIAIFMLISFRRKRWL
ncbi:MAG: magnesium/cobalt transporter CorA [Chloroflexi bacterium]|nr:magnesium/cobalt transporter CorA [Chloroflexota bacterium]